MLLARHRMYFDTLYQYQSPRCQCATWQAAKLPEIFAFLLSTIASPQHDWAVAYASCDVFLLLQSVKLHRKYAAGANGAAGQVSCLVAWSSLRNHSLHTNHLCSFMKARRCRLWTPSQILAILGQLSTPRLLTPSISQSSQITCTGLSTGR